MNNMMINISSKQMAQLLTEDQLGYASGRLVKPIRLLTIILSFQASLSLKEKPDDVN